MLKRNVGSSLLRGAASLLHPTHLSHSTPSCFNAPNPLCGRVTSATVRNRVKLSSHQGDGVERSSQDGGKTNTAGTNSTSQPGSVLRFLKLPSLEKEKDSFSCLLALVPSIMECFQTGIWTLLITDNIFQGVFYWWCVLKPQVFSCKTENFMIWLSCCSEGKLAGNKNKPTGVSMQSTEQHMECLLRSANVYLECKVWF